MARISRWNECRQDRMDSLIFSTPLTIDCLGYLDKDPLNDRLEIPDTVCLMFIVYCMMLLNVGLFTHDNR